METERKTCIRCYIIPIILMEVSRSKKARLRISVDYL